ncbi:MAG: methylated-DNA--[protein]-cysteine S-methyltransferase [Candidatus Methylomirabilia bacterium]
MVNVKEDVSYDLFRTSWGWVGVAFTSRGVRRLVLPRPDRAAGARELGLPPGAVLTPWESRGELLAFFKGEGACPKATVDLAGVPGFTRRVLDAARTIPPGTAITYGELARRAGSPRACRAAGQVMARNPVPLVIPCHRVVAAGGPGGYAGGPAMKARLLALESREAASLS